MGIFIHMSISRSVTKREWEKVYDETLQLVSALPLAEKKRTICRGIETICLVQTKEREITDEWDDDKCKLGWCAHGDYETMSTAEEYTLFRDMICDVDENAQDALLAYHNSDDSAHNNYYSFWGNKTQGEPYHICLLAIACLIEARLGEKAFIYGDITRGQCRKAVELANQHLKNPIDIPARCDLECFYTRVSNLPIDEKGKLEIFINMYLGVKDAKFGEYIRNVYPKEIFTEYWKERLNLYPVASIGFDKCFRDYLLWGFGLRELCSMVNFYDKENKPVYETFIKKILDAKLYIKDKDCTDILEIDPEEENPYSIYSLLAQFAFGWAKNKKVDRYIPIEEIREILINELGDKCDVTSIITECLQNTDDPSKPLTGLLKKKLEYIKNPEYDIISFAELLYYEDGDSIEPNLQANTVSLFTFYNNVTEEEQCKKLMSQSAVACYEWLIEENRTLLLRDKDWERIFDNISEDRQSFYRYYPMVRIKADNDDLIYLIRAFVLNDEFYAFCKEQSDTK